MLFLGLFWTVCSAERAPALVSRNIDTEVIYIVSKLSPIHTVWRENFCTSGVASLLTTHPKKSLRCQWVKDQSEGLNVVEVFEWNLRHREHSGRLWSMAKVSMLSEWHRTLALAPEWIKKWTLACTGLLVEVGMLNQQQGRQMVYLDSSDVLVRLR